MCVCVELPKIFGERVYEQVSERARESSRVTFFRLLFAFFFFLVIKIKASNETDGIKNGGLVILVQQGYRKKLPISAPQDTSFRLPGFSSQSHKYFLVVSFSFVFVNKYYYYIFNWTH